MNRCFLGLKSSAAVSKEPFGRSELPIIRSKPPPPATNWQKFPTLEMRVSNELFAGGKLVGSSVGIWRKITKSVAGIADKGTVDSSE